MKKNIAVISGGYSHEAEISYKSAETIIKHLPADKYAVYPITINQRGWYYSNDETVTINKNNFSLYLNNQTIQFDCVYIIIHGTPGEDGKLQAYFDMLGIPYNTSGVLPSALTFNKFFCNNLLRPQGINCAPAIIVNNVEEVNTEEIIYQVGLPCFVKPSDGGSSFGASKVKSAGELLPAIKLALEHGTQCLVEKFVSGTEVTCGVFKTKGKITVLPPTEIRSKNEFFDYKAKYKGESEEITPAAISPEMTEKIQSLTRKAYEILQLKSIARIDFIIEDNIPWLIEVNTVPGMSEQSIIPQQLKAAGITISEVLIAQIEEALSGK
jgi:D-alanine-D-alanine ligase